jgi:hypothetical protein
VLVVLTATLAGVRSHFIPTVVGETTLVRETVPENPFRLVTVIAERPAVAAFVVTEVGLATNVKSWIA